MTFIETTTINKLKILGDIYCKDKNIQQVIENIRLAIEENSRVKNVSR